jgi:hypothetical protein
MKYGRYYISSSRSASIIEEYLPFFSQYQHTNGQTHRLDALLIKPKQRITRYNQFFVQVFKQKLFFQISHVF